MGKLRCGGVENAEGALDLTGEENREAMTAASSTQRFHSQKKGACVEGLHYSPKKKVEKTMGLGQLVLCIELGPLADVSSTALVVLFQFPGRG